MTWTGWLRVPGGGWESVCVAEWGPCWDQLRAEAKKLGFPLTDLIVIPGNRHPDDRRKPR